MTTRSSFEAWYSEHGAFTRATERLPDGGYKFMSASAAWVNWRQATKVALETAAVVFEADENYRVCVDAGGQAINTPHQILRLMADEIK